MFSLKSAGICKYDRAMNTKEIFNFLPLINNSLTTGGNFLLQIISTIISSNIVNNFYAFPELKSSALFCTSFMSFEYLMEAFESLKCLRSTSSCLFTRYQYILTVFSHHVTYAFPSKSTLSSC